MGLEGTHHFNVFCFGGGGLDFWGDKTDILGGITTASQARCEPEEPAASAQVLKSWTENQ